DAQFNEFVGKLKRGFEQQTQIALKLVAQENWDVFMVHFQQTDWIQHKLWTYIEQGCKDANDHSSRIEETRSCYGYFDTQVGYLLEEVLPLSPSTILLSDHGFGRLMGNISANSYLKLWGYLSVLPESEDHLKGVKNFLRGSKTVRKVYHSLAGAKNR